MVLGWFYTCTRAKHKFLWYVIVVTTGGWYDVGRGVADGWTTGGVDIVGAAGPLPGQSHDITCTRHDCNFRQLGLG